MKAIVNVYLKQGVLDPQGKAAHHALGSLGFKGINDVRIGKQIVLDVDSSVTSEMIKEMCETLLANTVIEDYDFELKP
ncbi:Factor required for phosphoribosylformylglycinamidine synthetase, PurS component [Sulfurovum sp. enrichment culture clone C5]|uniref:Phosphoribosylformylglycinamidine synthase subunit PurS n=1 Tax=Sulfurovum sp. enrichment culture clone C5 TaxID=497650 RepID=A0A0S4XMM3_9BACT|nr:Factor required for phosphoribosylformylglycinamidine synthetase, PurS component [Sulfurovum sp. enrichment culture clone C5]